MHKKVSALVLDYAVFVLVVTLYSFVVNAVGGRLQVEGLPLLILLGFLQLLYYCLYPRFANLRSNNLLHNTHFAHFSIHLLPSELPLQLIDCASTLRVALQELIALVCRELGKKHLVAHLLRLDVFPQLATLATWAFSLVGMVVNV